MRLLQCIERAAYAMLMIAALTRASTLGAFLLLAGIVLLFVFRRYFGREAAWLPDRLLLCLPLFWAMEISRNLSPSSGGLLMQGYGVMILVAMTILVMSKAPASCERLAPELETGMTLALVFQLGMAIALRFFTDQHPAADFQKILWFTAAFYGSVPITYAVFSIGPEGMSVFADKKAL